MTRALVAFALTIALAALTACGGEEAAPPPEPAASEAADTGWTSYPAETSPEVIPVIVVDRPMPGDRVTSPVTVSGTADVFEANVTVEILGADGKELASDFTTATCGTGCRGDYSLELAFSVGEEQPGTIVVHDDDAAGTGTPPHVVEIPVTLVP